MDLKDYKLVWSEEFDGESLKDTKCGLSEDDEPRLNNDGEVTVVYSDDNDAVKVEDGKLILKTRYDEKTGVFVAPKSVNTKNTMSFMYGYLEVRARMPFVISSQVGIKAFAKGALGAEENAPYYSNMNVVYYNGLNPVMTNDVSKVYENYDENNPFYTVQSEREEPIEYATDSSERHQALGVLSPDCFHSKHVESEMGAFHTFGVLWTPEEIVFTVNGHKTARMNLTKDFGRPSGMDGFRAPHYLEFQNTFRVRGWYLGSFPTPQRVAKQCPLEIDYVRLYQKDGEGQLNVR